MDMRIRARGLAALGIVGCAAASQAIIAFDNFGANDAFNTSSGWTISGPNSVAGNFAAASQFTSLATGMLDRITIPIGLVTGLDQVSVQMLDDAGDVLGSGHITFGVGGLPSFGDAYAPKVLVNPFTDPNLFPQLVLHAGSKYWILVTSGSDTWAAWNLNSIGDSGLMAFSSNGGSTFDYNTNTRGAFRVEVFDNSVPGPAAFLPFALGLLAAWRKKR